jgi:hypothetical protein
MLRSLLEKLSGLAVGPKCDDRQYTRNRIAEAVVEIAPRVREIAVLEAALLEWSKPYNKEHRPGDADYKRALRALEQALEKSKSVGAA